MASTVLQSGASVLHVHTRHPEIGTDQGHHSQLPQETGSRIQATRRIPHSHEVSDQRYPKHPKLSIQSQEVSDRLRCTYRDFLSLCRTARTVRLIIAQDSAQPVIALPCRCWRRAGHFRSLVLIPKSECGNTMGLLPQRGQAVRSRADSRDLGP